MAGGLFSSVRNLGLSILRKHTDILLMSYDDEYSAVDRKAYEEIPMKIYHRSSLPLLNTLGYSKDIHCLLEHEKPDIIHTQGVWMYNSYATLKYKTKHRNSVSILTPRGMLDPWAIKNSSWKKKLAGFLFEYHNLKSADCIHALCQSEYESIRKFGLNNPVAIIPNGINIPMNPTFNRNKGNKTLLYIGRIHPKKGLREFILALGKIKKRSNGLLAKWKVRIAGWNQNGHINELISLVRENELERTVEFIGEVYGSDKDKELCRANAFILPSFSEGLPMSVLEAWAYRLPVVMTDYCNIPEGFDTDSAFRIDPNVDSIVKGLTAFLGLDDRELIQMGENGFQLVANKFTWDKIAEQTIQLYNYLINGGDKPEFMYD